MATPRESIQSMLSMVSMHGMNHRDLAGIDLNLLVVLDALLTECHVTRAARRVGLSQPATSHALARLRRLLEDPLLVRGPGGGLVLTSRAALLAPALRSALEGVAATLRGPPAFDPSTARHEIRIATADYAELVLLPRLAARLGREAPGVDLWSSDIPHDVGERLAAGAIDLILQVRGRSRYAGLYERPLFDETFHCVVRASHPIADKRLTLARYLALSHLLIAPRGQPGGVVDDALAALGKRRRVAMAVPHFLVAPHIVRESDLILTLATRLARLFAEPLELTVLRPPIALPSFTVSMMWHERAHHDPAHRWLREQIAAVAGEL